MTWEIASVIAWNPSRVWTDDPEVERDSRRLEDLLADGWEPFGATTDGYRDGTRIWLRKPPQESRSMPPARKENPRT